MKETIGQIRTLLSQLEEQATGVEHATEFRAFSGLELPDIICDTVDLLMPELKPYEVASISTFSGTRSLRVALPTSASAGEGYSRAS